MSPLFGRGKAKDEVPAVPQGATITGTLHCSMRGCPRQDAARCAYADPTGRHCDTAACALHQTVLHGTAYCIRHGNTMLAFDVWEGSGAEARLHPEKLRQLPEINNRAPNLVYWVCNVLDAQVRELLEERRTEGWSPVERHPLQIYGKGWNRRWVGGWSTVGPGDALLNVHVDIEDNDPMEVVVMVGDKVVEKSVPPWVRRNERMQRADTETDARERQEYFAAVMAAIRGGLNPSAPG